MAALFLLSSALGAFVLAGCDSGNSAATPTPAAAANPQDRGAVVFERYCNVCHPGGGRGAGPSLIPLLPTLSDDQVRAIVRQGRQRMPGYNEDTISDESLSDLIAYLRTLK